MAIKRLKNYLYWLLGTGVLLCTIFLCYLQSDPMADSLKFRIEQDAGPVVIDLYNAGEDQYCVFLPSYADLEHVFVEISTNGTLTLDGIALDDGMNCAQFQTGRAYALTGNGTSAGTLTFYQSSDIATMYIETASGHMGYIHEDKKNEEEAAIALYTADGRMDFADEFALLGGRGNTTWLLDKKPYEITLRKSGSLLGLSDSTQWVLLANGYDETHLRNKVIYDFADAVSTNYMLSPDCAYVEIYINGEYGGLYLLCQQIDTGTEALMLEAEDYYFELAWAYSKGGTDTAFNICDNRAVEVLFPGNISQDRLGELREYIAQFQNALFSENGVDPETGKGWDEYIDVDSVARKYLIDEVFANFDGGKSSQFFRMDGSEQKLYAGHCWDYDLTLGKYWESTWNTPYTLFAQRNWFEDTSWYYALCQQDAFMERVAEIYEFEFRPLLQYYMDAGLLTEAATVETAVPAEYIRWKSMYEGKSWEDSVAAMTEYLQAHVAFLDSLWLDKEEYCVITLQSYQLENVCVPKNTLCHDLPQPSELGAAGCWYVAQTNLPFDASQPITEDMVLIAVENSGDESEGGKSALEKLLQPQYLIVFASVGVVGLLLLGMVIVEILQRKGRGRTNGRKGKKVSS